MLQTIPKKRRREMKNAGEGKNKKQKTNIPKKINLMVS